MSEIDTGDDIGPHAGERAPIDRWILLGLAGASFALQSLLLTAVSVVAATHLANAAATGLAVGLVTGAGVLTDGLVGSLTHRIGTKPILLASYSLLTMGLAALALAASSVPGSVALLWAAALAFGFAFSLQTTPILGSLATHAGEGQIVTQSTNAIAQRGAALLVFLLLNSMIASTRLQWPMFVLLGVLTCLMAVGTVLLRSPTQLADAGPQHSSHSPFAALLVLSRSRKLRAAVIVNAATPLIVIFGASFMPLILLTLEKPQLLGLCLVGREAVAVAVSIWLRSRGNRTTFTWLWPATQIATVCGLLLGLISPWPWLTVLSFSLQGAMMGAGIVVGNVGLYDATETSDRFVGFAAASVVSRIASLVFPLVIGLAIAPGPLVAVLVLGFVLAIGYAWSRLLARPPRTSGDPVLGTGNGSSHGDFPQGRVPPI